MTTATRIHRYQVQTVWTGNTGQGTVNYRAYRRDHEISGPNKGNYLLDAQRPKR
jgi:hypothetical protein